MSKITECPLGNMEPDIPSSFDHITGVAVDAWAQADRSGFHGMSTPVERCALIMTELAELVEVYRAPGDLDKAHEAEEMADIVIRVFDLAIAQGIDIGDAIRKKMGYNATRPHRHGGKKL